MFHAKDIADFFVGWGTLSLINAGLAQSKGRSGFLWWLASLFLGPIATFLVVIVPAVPAVAVSGVVVKEIRHHS